MIGEVEQAWKWIDERAANVRGALHPDLARRVMVHRAEKTRDEARKRGREKQQATTAEDIDLAQRSEMLAWAKADRWSQHLSGVLRPLSTAPGMTRECGRESTPRADK